MSGLTLTADQQAAYEAFCKFILSPTEKVFVLEGYAGTGKSTLVGYLLDQLPKLLKTYKLINPHDKFTWDVVLTATTNKACEAFSMITGLSVITIQSHLKLTVQTDFKTAKTKLVPCRGANTPENQIIFIDEASYIDQELLKYIFDRTKNCKLIFIGDPAQLTPVQCNYTPVFQANFPTVRLSKVVRQAEGNPIIDLSTKFRETVSSGEFFSFKPDGNVIRYLPREEFEKEVLKEFTDPDWTYTRSKVLAWTNKTVVNYNQKIHSHIVGTPKLKVGDYAICNQFIQTNECRLRTDQMVLITHISKPSEQYGIRGHWFTLDNHHKAFMPDSLEEKKAFLKSAQKAGRMDLVIQINESWIDLRAAYACTINKSQGSTFDKVFIDLDDIKKCTSGNQIARMMYVAVSRAREKVILTGDLV